MKAFSAGKPIDRTRARNCALLNQLGTPGLGSLMGGKIVAGLVQLLTAVAGFAFVVVWFLHNMAGALSLLDSGVRPPESTSSPGRTGALLFAVAWIYSGITSLQLMREAQRNEGPPPPIIDIPPRLK